MCPLHVERDLECPAAVRVRVARASGLVDFLEAAVGSRARGQCVLGAEHVEVVLSGWIVIRIDNGDGLTRTSRGAARQVVRRFDRRWRKTCRASRCEGADLRVSEHLGMTTGTAWCGRPRADRDWRTS